MTKKSFKGANPALSFISGAEEAAEAKENEERAKVPARVVPEKQRFEDTDNTQDTHITKAKAGRASSVGRSKTGRETKSKRVNLVLQPSIWENATKIAHMKRTTLNDVVNTLLREYTEREADEVQRYDDFFRSMDNE
jgi:hypothetical protein